MSAPWAIESRLTSRHLADFHELINNRAVTVVSAMAWLTAHGYRVAHGSVGGYMRVARARGLFPLRPLAGLRNDKATRRQLAVWAQSLAGDDLTELALYAVYRLNISAARNGSRPPDFPGTMPMRLKGDRTQK